jgi:glycosyltransferase involved in cell wall biosynthesis
MPVYNGANYMRTAIDSALGQSWPNTEIVIVNDGSCDDGQTERIARSYGERVKYISKPNGGVASALNAGIAAMSGEIFCWLSHDDRHLPEKTSRQVAEWDRLGRPDVVLITDYRLIDAAGNTITDVRLNHALLTEKPSYALLRGSINGCSVFAPKVLFERIGLFDESLPTTQDYDLWRRSFRQFPFIHMPEVLIESRWHDEQGSKKIDHILEATQFWKRVVDDIPVNDQEAWEGSSHRFLSAMAEILQANKLTDAAADLRDRAKTALNRTPVSVVIPFYNRTAMAVSAIESAAVQTHENIEIIVVNDGSSEDISEVEAAVKRHHPRARMLHQKNSGPAAARNAGWKSANGSYVAFLDADDLFVPTKLSNQLLAMEVADASFCHTSYWRHSPWETRLTRIDSGAGNSFPEIIGSCGIATPTVMVKRALLDEGFAFPEDIRYGEDIVLWISIAARFGSLGIDQALTVVRANNSSTAYDDKKSMAGVRNILAAVRNSPELLQYKYDVEKLETLAAHLASKVSGLTEHA